MITTEMSKPGRLRVHFTPADLARVRTASSVDAGWETVLAAQALTTTGRHAAPTLSVWRRRAWAGLKERGLTGAVNVMNDLAPNDASYFPDLLTPPAGVEGMSACVDELLTTPRKRIAHELIRAERKRGSSLSPWSAQLAEGDRERLDELGALYRTLYSTIIAPDWTFAAATVESVGLQNLRTLGAAGLEVMLGSFMHGAQWSPPVLELSYPFDRDVHLRGRGLMLIPSYFCWRYPVAIVDPGLDPVLAYPVWGAGGNSVETVTGSTRVPDMPALSDLMGSTRARVLAALRQTRTTGGLARHLSISKAAASEHAQTLRNAGLVESQRDGMYVLHTLTPLGQMLLLGDSRL